MPASPTPLPSRHRLFQLAGMIRRLRLIDAVLDARVDRHAPLPVPMAGEVRRTLGEARALLGMAPSRRLESTRRPVDFLIEAGSVSDRLTALNQLMRKAEPAEREPAYPRPAAPW